MEKCPSVFHSEYDVTTADSLCAFFVALANLVQVCMKTAPYFSLLCFLINIFHLIVLTQKSMRVSSVNVILAVVALTDCCFLMFPIQLEAVAIYDHFLTCSNPNAYTFLLLKSIFDALQFFARRCSVWFSLSIAIIRTLIIRNPLNPKIGELSKPKAMGYCVIIISPICIPITVLGCLKYKLVVNPDPAICSKTNETIFGYLSQYSDLFTANNYFIFHSYNLIDSILSKLIPCVLFPIFTFLLFKEILKTEENRAKISRKSENLSGRKTKLVLCLTLTFFLADFPLGIIIFMKLFFSPSSAVVEILNLFTFLFSLGLTINTSTHMLVCMKMSSQYRQTVKDLCCCCPILQSKKQKSSIKSAARVDRLVEGEGTERFATGQYKRQMVHNS